ncbi:CDP-glycerol glycerophosphotransferase family protein [Curtobacterium sp. MCPF17_046]|uniref:CDP-glycerol glycerophosphotransferase family protein n=1 Tax=Curtobacterium sp. MCPF17_046 TaxID=2175663 RepID=UPI0015E89AD9|nr:CDP-glycerol glycerophosphotransferase family protein [Curtobacterium sp. MCPF17_046]
MSKTLAVMTHLLRRQRLVVVNGFPALEGNAVQIVRELQDRYDGRITWIDAPSERELSNLDFVLAPHVRTAKYWSFAALSSYVVAETIFYTHGLYGNPRLAPSRSVVNLWHGHGIKRVDYPGYATHLVVPTQLHAETRASAFRVDPANVLIALPPRTARLREPATATALTRLGLSGKPFVVWMPTYRKAAVKEGTNDGWVSTAEDVGGRSTTQAIQDGFDVLRARGIEVVVKAHPADTLNRHVPGALNISSDVLTAAGTTLYNVLGASAGLITDYSSVWFEYFAIRKPIAYFMPDKVEYVSTRGVVPGDALDWLPGPELVAADDFNRLADEILSGRCFEEHRERSSEHFGLVDEWPSQGSVLDELARRRLIRLHQ